MLLRIAEEVEVYLVELGDDGRLIGCSSTSWSTGWPRVLAWWSVTTARLPPGRRRPTGASVVDRVVDGLAPPAAPTNCSTRAAWPRSCGLPARSDDTDVGHRAAGLPAAQPLAAVLRHHRRADRGPFVSLQRIMRASLGDLEQVEGVGEARARSVKDGLARLAEASISSATSSGRPGGSVGRRLRIVVPVGRAPAPCTMGCFPYAVPCRSPSPGPARNARRTVFDIGDKVVYPHHGAAVVERRETKEAFGEKQEYLVLRLAYGDLT